MGREELKKVTAEVNKETWKALKVLAVQKEVSLQQVVQDILEKSMSKRVKTSNNDLSEET